MIAPVPESPSRSRWLSALQSTRMGFAVSSAFITGRSRIREAHPGSRSSATRNMKDSLWSMDLFRCESASLRTHSVLIVKDQYSRRIIGFGVHAGTVDGVVLCRMFNRAIRWQIRMPKYLSTDNDPLYRFHQWLANPPRAGGDRNQDGALCAFIPSVCRAAHRDLAPRMRGPQVILDHHRLGGQATRVPTLL